MVNAPTTRQALCTAIKFSFKKDFASPPWLISHAHEQNELVLLLSRPECEKQIKGVVGAKFKKFDSLKEAEVFVKEGPQQFTKPVKPKVVALGGLRVVKGSTPYDRPDPSTSSSSSSSKTKDHFVRVNGVRVAASDSIVVYTDGSSRGNGQQGCQAGLGVFFGVNDPRNVSERLAGEPQTNQRAELTVKRIDQPPICLFD